MKTLKELLEAKTQKRTQADKIIKLGETEKRSLTPEEGTQVDGLLDEIDALNIEIEARQAAQTRTERLERSAGTPIGSTGVPLPEIRNNIEPGADLSDPVEFPDPTKYRLMRAIENLHKGKAVTGYEGEISQEIAKRQDKQPGGFFMPSNLAMRAYKPGDPRAKMSGAEQRTGLDTTAGAGGIPTILDTGRFIDSLKALPVVAQMGATFLTDLVGVLNLPRLSANIGTYWVGEQTAPTLSNNTIDTVALTAKTLGATTIITRRMRHQTSLDVENLVRRNMLWMMALGIDSAALAGSGSGSQPTGLLNLSGIGTTALGTNGADPTWNAMVLMEAAINDANAMTPNMGYITSQVGRGKLKFTPKIGTTFPSYIWQDDNTINGYKAMSTTLISKTLTKGSGTNLTAMLFGNWASLLVGLWGGIDIIVDPYSNSTSGDLKVTMLQDADINVQHVESFNKIVDMIRV
jgi:HK97 family phage major capsid protein